MAVPIDDGVRVQDVALDEIRGVEVVELHQLGINLPGRWRGGEGRERNTFFSTQASPFSLMMVMRMLRAAKRTELTVSVKASVY